MDDSFNTIYKNNLLYNNQNDILPLRNFDIHYSNSSIS